MMESLLNMLNSVKSANYTLSHDAAVLEDGRHTTLSVVSFPSSRAAASMHS